MAPRPVTTTRRMGVIYYGDGGAVKFGGMNREMRYGWG